MSDVAALKKRIQELEAELEDARSKLKETEHVKEELHDTEIFLETVFNAIPDIIGVQDVEHKIIRYNEAGYNFLGKKVVEVKGKKCFDLIGKAGPCELCATSETYTTLKPAHVEKYVDSMKAWLDVRCYPVLNEKGQLVKVIEHLRDITPQKENEQILRSTLKEKEVLIQEIHHRVKNNLQIIVSLLRLQASSSEDEHSMQILHESERRVHAMALIHEQLYHAANLSHIDVKDYLQDLIKSLQLSFDAKGKGIDLKLDVDSTCMNIDTIVPCGLVVNELVTNALKHAFPEETSGEKAVKITMKTSGNQNKLIIEDNGTGIPEAINLKETESLGLRLVTMLVEQQLKGTLRYESSGGSCFIVEFSA